MNWFEGIGEDMNFIRPKIYISETQAIIENVASIISLSDTQITVSSGGTLGRTPAGSKKKIIKKTTYTTISGMNFYVKEISDGRILIEGQIQKVEFLQPQSGA